MGHATWHAGLLLTAVVAAGPPGVDEEHLGGEGALHCQRKVVDREHRAVGCCAVGRPPHMLRMTSDLRLDQCQEPGNSIGVVGLGEDMVPST